MFICEFCKIFKNIFRQNTSGWLHLWILRSFFDHFFYRETACFMHKFKRISTTRYNKKHFTSAFQVFYIRTRSSYSKAFIYWKLYVKKLQDAKLRSSCPEVFYKIGVIRNFAKLTGKHLCQRLFFNKVSGLACNFIKKESLARLFFLWILWNF